MTTTPTPASQPSPAPDAYAVYFVRRGSGTEDRLLVSREEDAHKQVDVGLIRRVVPLFAEQPSPARSDLTSAILALQPQEGQTPGFLVGFGSARAAAAELTQRSTAPARSDKDAVTTAAAKLINVIDVWRDASVNSVMLAPSVRNLRAALVESERASLAAKAQESAPSSIDTPEFLRLMEDYREGKAPYRKVLAYIEVRRATAGTTAAPSSEPKCRGCDPAEGFCKQCREAERATAGNAAPTCRGCDPAEGFCKQCRDAEKRAATAAPGDLTALATIADQVEDDGLFNTANSIRDWIASNAGAAPGCACRACNPHMVGRMMFICPTCGDKRCPRAADHRDACAAAPSSPVGAKEQE